MRVATLIGCDNGIAFCQYHATKVVLWDVKQIVLNSGGFRTATTKRRMNQVSADFELNFQVYQKKDEWFIAYKGLTHKFYDNIVLAR